MSRRSPIFAAAGQYLWLFQAAKERFKVLVHPLFTPAHQLPTSLLLPLYLPPTSSLSPPYFPYTTSMHPLHVPKPSPTLQGVSVISYKARLSITAIMPYAFIYPP